ncbi:MAG: FtsW/RodA/SpoVE family cell cycle protein [Bacteroidales bacterium]|nr:FtsW/RodA/SpoVE family cell cycle protein [Bacteroidales bacterium]
MAGRKGRNMFWRFVDNLEGDKAVWMIALLLMALSIICIFSSTTLLANSTTGTTRVDIVREHLFIVLAGLAVMIGIYNINDMKWFRTFGKYSFLLSFIMLMFLTLRINLGVVRACEFNGAWRAIMVFGFQVHVFEVVKVLMVMYLAWAIDTVKHGELTLAEKLSNIKHLEFLRKDFWRRAMYIYFPVFTVCLLVMTGSVSSMLFIGTILFLVIIIGGIRIRELIPIIVAGIAVVSIIVVGYNKSDGRMFSKFERIPTAVNRITRGTNYYLQEIQSNPKNSEKWQDAVDDVRQPMGAKLAIKEGGILGKGPGHSTQRYVVSVMYGDYMFAFIVEEYGIIGALLIIMLYLSLVSRGSAIARNLDNQFAQCVVAGLAVLITGQALMHMFINIDLGPLTGQTLPMISHGKSSFLVFSAAFGVILSISRIAKKKLASFEEKEKARLVNSDNEDEYRPDDINKI